MTQMCGVREVEEEWGEDWVVKELLGGWGVGAVDGRLCGKWMIRWVLVGGLEEEGMNGWGGVGV